MRTLMTGDEALARGAYEAGVAFASAYPGTPSTEILENITGYKDIISEWASNEKVAMEAAAGASLAGARSLASMKHVGVNVAADPLFTFSYTGVNAGMVLISADEPGQHSSQNEQDNRWYAVSAKLPMLEPSDSQECLDMMKAAYDLSEEYDTPVLMRITTRVAHSKSPVSCGERAAVPVRPYVKNVAKYVTVPSLAVKMRVKVEERMGRLKAFSEKTPLNYIEKVSRADTVRDGSRIGVIASGMAYYYAKEVLGDGASYLKLGFTNPLPDALLDEFYTLVDKVYIIEEHDPYLEQWVKSRGYSCIGKDIIPPYGELTPDVLRKAILGGELEGPAYDRSVIIPRPPALCAGCPHRGLFYELAKRKNTVIAGDIGCYTLGFADPYNAMDFVVCMGASFSSGHGAQRVFTASGSENRVVGIMGDSTFFHTGINSLIEVLYNNSKTICIILDNRITGMTGHQENPGTGKNAAGDAAPEIDIESVVKALGAKNVASVNPNDLKAVRKALDDAYSKDGPSVIITRWPCVLKRLSAADKAEFGADVFTQKYGVDGEKCIACKMCVKAGCPALSCVSEKIKENSGKMKIIIDQGMCAGCGVCAQICPKQAIMPS
ncbi:MAG: indolepyruvate ferredoxin oxidoreductase subunit alpha [Clostridiales bacterium]|jgi:indolepyruvate ferredoxin oxidoreductase alpha subunit|nr:indolepyruvate ferredoxin oxidoreductase subunit alpha [Clostridiales bacterium]